MDGDPIRRPRQTRPGDNAPPAVTPRLRSVRHVDGWICLHPDNLVDRDIEQPRQMLDRCPELRSVVELVRSGRHDDRLNGRRLAGWITAAEQAALRRAGRVTPSRPRYAEQAALRRAGRVTPSRPRYAEQAALPGIGRFATGLTVDLAAVTVGLSLPFSSGPARPTSCIYSDVPVGLAIQLLLPR
nr:hypothetical protein GCM10020092_002300 [Actinoplanes digitatis]